MENQSLKVFVNNVHEYDYEKVDNAHILYYSCDDSCRWTRPGEIAIHIIDDGNGLVFESALKSRKRIDYHNAFMLSIMLQIIELGEKNKSNIEFFTRLTDDRQF